MRTERFHEVNQHTNNVTPGRNLVQGVVLHHTATTSVTDALNALCYSSRGVSCHALIDRDGTRYILASPTEITHHAGYSWLNGKSSANRFTIGIEFQGNTRITPLTDAQINSAVEYLVPIIKKYHIPLQNVVSHEYVRNEWLKRHPDRKDVPTKVDITDKERQRVVNALRAQLQAPKARRG